MTMIWDRFQGDFGTTFAGVDTSDADELISNQGAAPVGSGLAIPTDIVVVDGVLTVITDTDDLIGIRLCVLNENWVLGDFSAGNPEPHDPSVYYSWFAGRGPLVFRLRTKRTVHPEHKLWIHAWKAAGTSVTTIRYGLLLGLVVKH